MTKPTYIYITRTLTLHPHYHTDTTHGVFSSPHPARLALRAAVARIEQSDPYVEVFEPKKQFGEEWGISAWRRDGGCRIEGTVRRLEIPGDVVRGILMGTEEGGYIKEE